MTFTVSLGMLFVVLVGAFVLGLLSPLFLLLYFVWNGNV